MGFAVSSSSLLPVLIAARTTELGLSVKGLWKDGITVLTVHFRIDGILAILRIGYGIETCCCSTDVATIGAGPRLDATGALWQAGRAEDRAGLRCCRARWSPPP